VRIAHLAGLTRAKEMIMRGRRITAREALDGARHGGRAGWPARRSDCPLGQGSRGASTDPPSRHSSASSRFKASPELIRRLSNASVAILHDPHELIVLRDMDGNLIDYRDTHRTNQMRDHLQAINEGLVAAAIGLQGRIIQAGDPLSLGGVHVGAVHSGLHRVFNRGSFNLGGRLPGGRTSRKSFVRTSRSAETRRSN
jgi:hypothetical protein